MKMAISLAISRKCFQRRKIQQRDLEGTEGHLNVSIPSVNTIYDIQVILTHSKQCRRFITHYHHHYHAVGREATKTASIT